MRKVVSNTTPILSLLKINQLHLFEALYGHVYVPFSVLEEIEAGKNGTWYTDIKLLPHFNIVNVTEPPLFQSDELDQGEKDVIALALELNADLVILDETLARTYAKSLQLQLTGTLGILLKAKQQNLIESIGPLINQLQANGVWLSRNVIHEVLTIAGEQ